MRKTPSTDMRPKSERNDLACDFLKPPSCKDGGFLQTAHVYSKDSALSFGNALAADITKVAGAEIKRIPFLNSAEKFFQWQNGSQLISSMTKGGGKWLNMSVEDWIIRISLIPGLYLPQTLIAFHEDKHKYETLGRNVLSWSSAVLFTFLTKHPTIGVNAFLNFFMEPKKPDLAWPSLKEFRHPQVAVGKLMRKLTNPLAMEFDYLDLLQKAGVEAKDRSRWIKTDQNQLEKVLQVTLNKAKEKSIAALAPEEARAYKAAQNSLENAGIFKVLKVGDQHTVQKLLKKGMQKALTVDELALLRHTNSFFNRVNLFKVISFAVFAALNYYLIGQLVMELVFRLFAPMDHDFRPDRFHGKTLFGPKAPPPDTSRAGQKVTNPSAVTLAPATAQPPSNPFLLSNTAADSSLASLIVQNARGGNVR